MKFAEHIYTKVKDGVFAMCSEIDRKAVTQAFGERVLAQLHKRELITDDVVAQILSQDHSGCGVWIAPPLSMTTKASSSLRATSSEPPLSLEQLSIQDDIVTYTTKDGAAHEFHALEFLAELSSQVPLPYESLTRWYGRYSCRRRGQRAKLLLLQRSRKATIHARRQQIAGLRAPLPELL